MGLNAQDLHFICESQKLVFVLSTQTHTPQALANESEIKIDSVWSAEFSVDNQIELYRSKCILFRSWIVLRLHLNKKWVGLKSKVWFWSAAGLADWYEWMIAFH